MNYWYGEGEKLKLLEGVVKAFKHGDSIAITIPKKTRDKFKIKEGTFIKFYVEGKKILLEVEK